MDYPLTKWQIFWRETICFFTGHKWKHSPRRQTKYYDAPDTVPYGLHKETGNALFEYIAWWSGKCVRCRYKARRNEMWDPWYKTQYWAFRGAWSDFKWHSKYSFFETETPLPWNLGAIVIPMACVSALKTYLIHFERLPWSWWMWLADIEYWYYSKIDGD